MKLEKIYSFYQEILRTFYRKSGLFIMRGVSGFVCLNMDNVRKFSEKSD